MHKSKIILNSIKKFEEFDRKIRSIKNKVNRTNSPEMRKQNTSLIFHLEELRDKMQKQYMSLLDVDNQKIREISKYKKNMEHITETFNAAYSVAGSMLSREQK